MKKTDLMWKAGKLEKTADERLTMLGPFSLFPAFHIQTVFPEILSHDKWLTKI